MVRNPIVGVNVAEEKVWVGIIEDVALKQTARTNQSALCGKIGILETYEVPCIRHRNLDEVNVEVRS